MRTHQLQTNISVQTMETSIWVIRSTSKGRGAERWEGGFAKVWLPNPMAGPDCKITQFSIPLGCWSNDLDWSFHNLHGEVGLHLIRQFTLIYLYLRFIKLVCEMLYFLYANLFSSCIYILIKIFFDNVDVFIFT